MIVALRLFLRTSRQCHAQTFRLVPNLPTLTLSDLQPHLTSFLATHPQNPPVTPFPATHTISPSCKSLPCHTYKKNRGVSPWECGGLFIPSLEGPPLSRPPISRQSQHIDEARYVITYYFLA